LAPAATKSGSMNDPRTIYRLIEEYEANDLSELDFAQSSGGAVEVVSLKAKVGADHLFEV
jgi:hypothetical protein